MPQLFFSYSHRDEALRDELEIHLAQLKNEGIIETWHDRRIPAGDEFDNSISEHLESADIVLLLVSPYFLASRYCYQVEMKRALERHNAKEACVIPIILHPCDWKTAPFAKLQAATLDARPVSKYANQHDAFLEIVQAIRKVVSKIPNSAIGPSPEKVILVQSKSITVDHRSSNLRIKKEFTDREQDSFIESAFEFISNYFEASLTELQIRNPNVSSRFRRVTADHFTAEIYRQGKRVGACGIRLGATFGRNQISFNFDPNAINSMNEAISVDNDGHTLFFKPLGLSSRVSRNEQLSQQGAAEMFWSMLIEPLQR